MPVPSDPGVVAALVFFGSFAVLAIFLSVLKSGRDSGRNELYRRNLRDQHRD